MKIATRLRIGPAIVITVMLIGASLVGLFSNRAAQETEQSNLATQMNTAVSELNIITYEFLLHFEERMEQQWHSRYDSALVLLHLAAEEHPEWTESMRTSFAHLRELFLGVAAKHDEEQKLIREGVVRPFFWTLEMTSLRTQFFNIPLSKPLALKLSRGQVAQR